MICLPEPDGSAPGYVSDEFRPKEEVAMKKTLIFLLSFIGSMLFVDSSSAPFSLPAVFAHCDTLDGPVVKTAKAALEKGDVTPILKWVKKEDEAEIKDLFKKTI